MISKADLQGKNAEFIDPKRYAQLMIEADRTQSF